MIWIDAISFAITSTTVVVAAIVDFKTMRIPNVLTFLAIALGLCLLLIRCALGFSLTWALVYCMVSYVLAYALWKGGLWGGGDAKLTIAILLLLSPLYAPLFYMAAFLACLAFTLFIKHFLLGALTSDARLAAYGISPFVLSSAVIAILWDHGRLIAAFAGILVFAIAADLISDLYRYTEKVPVGSAIGRRLAEDIYLHSGIIKRRKRHASAIRGWMDPIKGQFMKCQAMGHDEIEKLRIYGDEVEVYLQRPMGPSILIACILAALLGWTL